MHTRSFRWAPAIVLSLLPLSARAAEPLWPGYAWAENLGWIHLGVESDAPAQASLDFLSGFIRGEGIGWIHLGDGTPADGYQYANDSAADCGVNRDGFALSGWAWGESIGWIDFAPASGPGVRITPDGKLLGAAWAESAGWIVFLLARPLVEGASPDPIVLAPTYRTQLFSLDAGDSAEPILLTLSDPDPENANSLYVRWGEPPTESEWDMAAAEPGQAEQRLVIPGDRDLACTILVRADVIAGSSSEVTLRAEKASQILQSMYPRRSSQGSTASVEIAGGEFDATTTFALVHASAHEIPSSAAEVLSDTQAQALFDLGGAPLGSYDLRARRLETDALLAGAFEVVPPVLGPRLDASLEGVAQCEYLLETPFALRYRNAGDSQMTAPLVKLSVVRTACSAEGTTRLGLERRGDVWLEELLALAVERDGVAGELGPGDALELLPLWVLTELDPCPGGECSPCEVELRAEVFRPEGAGAIAWDELPAPAGVSGAEWAEIRPELRAMLGETWAGYHESLAQLATRLSRRGTGGASVLDLFRFAARQAYGRPACAVAGSLVRVDGATGRRLPLAGRYVVAREEGAVKSSARTDAQGRFAIDWLESGKLYEIAAADGAGARSLTLPASGDVLGFDIEVPSLGEGPDPGCPNRDESGLPLEPLMPPAEHFDADQVPPLKLEVVRAFDPNEKIGPSGVLEGRVVSIFRPIRYLVTFENLGTGSVWRVTVADELHPGLDPSTVEFHDVGLVSVAEGADRVLSTSTYGGSRLLELAEGQQLMAAPAWNPSGTEARWQLQSVDTIEQTATTPLTHVPVQGSAGYFLPPHDPESPQVGRVCFSVRPRRDLPEGEEITNEACIYFNNDPEPVRTGLVVNQVSHFLEVLSSPSPPPGGEPVPLGLTLTWGSVDPPEAAWPITYDVFVWEGGSPRPESPAASGLAERRYKPRNLRSGRVYNWSVVARNEGGSRESPVWSFETIEGSDAPFERGNANADATIDLSDAVTILGYLFLGSAMNDCEDAADVNDDGGVDISDAVRLLGYLFLGSPRPPDPFGACGSDPTDDELTCQLYDACP